MQTTLRKRGRALNKYEVLKHYFGYTCFRGGQEQLIDAALSGRDALGIMPTGGGKSLCYQIPALIFSGITLVISPLISLMKDQVMALTNMKIAAAYINSSLSYDQLLKVYGNLRRGVYKILYIAPERLDSDGFAELVRQMPVSMIAVDEAHCISEWGNDFRPSYLRIADFIASLPRRPVVTAFTATATEQVRRDIEEKLKLDSPVRVVTGFDRPNLKFDVIKTRKKLDILLELVGKRREKSGIIYCMTRANVEKLCEILQKNGFSATRYHAGLDESERHSNQEDFIYDRKTVMVATNAFGMGIDKSNVSFVIHYNMPMSLEAYYQEAGRAGRDGESAECILIYSPGDIHTAKTLIEYSEESDAITEEERQELKRREYNRLSRMIEYCNTTKCLRGNILDYFGQEHEDVCGNCGNCNTVFRQKDITVEAQKILSCIKRIYDRLGYSVGIALIIRVLHGSEVKRITSLGLNEISTYGIMKELPINEISDMVNYIVERGYAYKDASFGALRLTDRAYAVLFGGERVIMEYKELPPDEYKKKKKEHTRAQLPSSDTGLYERLRKLRFVIANEQKVPAYIVFSNATLADMANKKPASMREFTEVSGVGKVKAELYGERFIAEIRDYTIRHGE